MSDVYDDLTQDQEAEQQPFSDIISDSGHYDKLLGYLHDELSDVLDSRSDLEEQWKEFRRISQARPREKVKNTPWENASNVSSRITMSVINTLYAHMKGTFRVRKPLFNASSADPQYREHARVAQDMVNRVAESRSHMDIRSKNSDIFYDLIRMGTHFVEVPWKTKEWVFKRTEASGETIEVQKTVYDAPDVNSFRIEDVITREQWADIQDAPWVALRFRFMDYEIEQLSQSGFFENTDKLLESGEMVTETDENREEENQTVGYDADYSEGVNKTYELFKVYLFFDGDGDRRAEPLIVWYSLQAEAIVKVEYNELGIRPIARIPYIPLPGQLYAMGVGHVATDLQDEIDTLRNIRINSMHLSSLQILGVARSADFGPRETLKPGKIIRLDYPQQDIAPIAFPDVSGASMNGEHLAKQELMEGTGANSAMMGQPDQVAKSGTSTSLQTFLAQRGGTVAAAIAESVEEGYGNIGLYTLMQLVNNTERAREQILPLLADEDQEIAQEILSMNAEDIATQFKFSVETTDLEKTDEAKRQQILMIHELYNRYAQEMMQVYQIMLNPQVPEQMKQFASKIYVGKTKLLERALELFGEKETEDYLPYYKDVELINDMIRSMKQAQVEMMEEQNGNSGARGMAAGGNTGAEGAPAESGMGGNSEETV